MIVTLTYQIRKSGEKVGVYGDYDARPPKYWVRITPRGLFAGFRARTLDLASRMESGKKLGRFELNPDATEIKVIYDDGSQQKIAI